MCRDKSPLEKAVDFHGHICPGLLMGVRAAEFALQYLNVDPDYDEELVAVVETDACGADAIQAILGCTFGKGNLIFWDYGKHVYIVASREKNRAVRIAARFGALDSPENSRYRQLNNKGRLTAEEEAEREDLRGILFERIMSMPFEELFNYRDIDFKIPPRARIHQTVCCAGCGEGVMETRVLMTDKGPLCPECQAKEA